MGVTVSRLVHAVDGWIPSSSSTVVRGSPDLEDQSLAIAEQLSDRRYGPVTVLVQDRESLDLPMTDWLRSRGVQVLDFRSMRGQLAYLRARLRFQTQGGWPAVAGKVTVNVWHGMPVKKIAADAGGAYSSADVMVATSPVFQTIMAGAWRMDPERVLVTGLPRNDRLLASASSEAGGPIAAFCDGRPMVLILPTYHRQVGSLVHEGIERPGVLNLPDGDVQELDGALAGAGIQCIVKPHPLAAPREPWVGSNVSVISGEQLARSGVSLYQLMGQASMLVTDYSSAWIDFLLLDRTLVFTMSDLAEYESSRGVYFGDLKDWVPGPVVGGVTALAEELTAASRGRDEFAERRHRRLTELHTHNDSASTERLLAAVEPLVARANARGRRG